MADNKWSLRKEKLLEINTKNIQSSRKALEVERTLQDYAWKPV